MTKPILGLAGGIGSGKSTVARLMGSMGGYVIDADRLAREALDRPEVREELVRWWGTAVLDAGGRVDRKCLADQVFDDPSARQRLEGLIHPLVQRERARLAKAAEADPNVRFIVQDVPLLFEVGADKECDLVVFVDASPETRRERLQQARGWNGAELERREKNQWPLDRKKSGSHAIITNDGDESQCFEQVRSTLKRLLQGI